MRKFEKEFIFEPIGKKGKDEDSIIIKDIDSYPWGLLHVDTFYIERDRLYNEMGEPISNELCDQIYKGKKPFRIKMTIEILEVLE